MGCRKLISIALVAPFVFGLVPAALAAPSDASLPACGLSRTADRFTDSDDGYTGDGEPADRNDRDRQACASGTDAGVSAPDKTIYFTPVLQDHDDIEDDTTVQVRHLMPHRAPHLPAI